MIKSPRIIIRFTMPILLLAAFITLPVHGDEGVPGDKYPLIKAVVKPQKATVGDILHYTLNIAGKGLAGIEVAPPEKREFYPPPKKKKRKIEADKAGGPDKEEDPADSVPLYIIHSVQKHDRSTPDMTDITVEMSLSYYRTGKFRLPDLEIKGKDKTVIGYNVPFITINELNKEGKLQEIEPPLEPGRNYTRLIFLLLGVAALTAIVIVLTLYIIKKRKERAEAPVIIPPIDIFMKEIQRFKGNKLIDKGKVDEYVFGISMIFRKFLSARFKFDAAEMTTNEIRRMMQRSYLKRDFSLYESEIVKCLELWDLSKFAEFAPSPEILYDNLDRTIVLAKKLADPETVHSAGGAG